MNKKLSIVLGIIILIALIIWIVALDGSSEPVTTVDSPMATVAISSVENSSESNAAAAVLAGTIPTKTVTWKVEGYPKDAGININLLRKTSDSPVSYELVRVIAENTANDGSEIWQPEVSDGSDLYVEVTCSTTYTFDQGCSVTGAPFKVQ